MILARKVAVGFAAVGVVVLAIGIAAANGSSNSADMAGVIGMGCTSLFVALALWYFGGVWLGATVPTPELPPQAKGLLYPVYCKRCGTVGEQEFYRKGSLLLGVVLLCCFILPGILYFIWYFGAGYWGCPRCQAEEIVPVDSPVARQALGAQ
jgi:hypothetical protein